MLDFTKSVELRNGWKFNLWKTDAKDSAYPVYGSYINEAGFEISSRWTIEGRWNEDKDNSYDLVNIPGTHTRYVNCFNPERVGFKSKEAADAADSAFAAAPKRTACISVTWKDGDGLDD